MGVTDLIKQLPEAFPSVEKVLNSKGRVRILKLLATETELNISAIVNQTGLSFSNVNIHLKALTELDILHEKKYGRIRIYTWRYDTPHAQLILNFFESWAQNTQKMMGRE